MRQYQQFKAQHPGYVLFFRMGDFYEMFWDDAKTCAKALGVALTSRNKNSPDEIPMAGVPFHAVEGYLRKMIAQGHKVAICEQTEDAALAKGLVKREVVRLMTPGTLTDDPLLDGRADNYLAAIAFHVTRADGYRAGLAWVELSTGACTALSGSEGQVLDEIARLQPAEVLVPEMPSGRPHDIAAALGKLGFNAVTARPGWQFTPHHAKEQIQRQWQARTAGGFGFTDDDPAVLAARVGLLGEVPPTGLVGRDRRQGALEKGGSVLDGGEGRVAPDEILHQVQPRRLQPRPDVVHRNGRQDARPQNAERHGQDAAEAGAEQHHAVQVQRRHRVQEVAQRHLHPVAAGVGRPRALAVPRVVQRHHAPNPRVTLADVVEVERGARHARQAEQRQPPPAALRAGPLHRRKAQTVARREAPAQGRRHQPLPRSQRAMGCSSEAVAGSRAR